MNTVLNFRLRDKLLLLKALYSYLETSLPKDELFCKPECFYCCTTKIYATSLEARYLLPLLPKETIKGIKNLSYPRPKHTHNELVRLYRLGSEILEEEDPKVEVCPFLTKRRLCSVYEARPLMCRIMVSKVNCQERGVAEPPEFHYTVSLLLLQIVENIDLGGLYGNLFDLLTFWQDFLDHKIEEVPSYLLSNVEEEEYPLLPHEREYHQFLGGLYCQRVNTEKNFRELWLEMKEDFAPYRSLDFLRDL